MDYLKKENLKKAFELLTLHIQKGGERHDLLALFYGLGWGCEMNFNLSYEHAKKFQELKSTNPQLVETPNLKYLQFFQGAYKYLLTENKSLILYLHRLFKSTFSHTNASEFYKKVTQASGPSQGHVLALFAHAVDEKDKLLCEYFSLIASDFSPEYRQVILEKILSLKEDPSSPIHLTMQIIYYQILLKEMHHSLDSQAKKVEILSIMESIKDHPDYDPYDYACIHLDGNLVEKDEEKAIAYYLKSLNKGNLYASYDLGSIYLHREKANFQRALDYFQPLLKHGIDTSLEITLCKIGIWNESKHDEKFMDPAIALSHFMIQHPHRKHLLMDEMRSLLPEEHFEMLCKHAFQKEGYTKAALGKEDGKIEDTEEKTANTSSLKKMEQNPVMTHPDESKKTTEGKDAKKLSHEKLSPPESHSQKKSYKIREKILEERKKIPMHSFKALLKSLKEKGAFLKQGAGSRLSVFYEHAHLHMHLPHGKKADAIQGERLKSLQTFLEKIEV